MQVDVGELMKIIGSLYVEVLAQKTAMETMKMENEALKRAVEEGKQEKNE